MVSFARIVFALRVSTKRNLPFHHEKRLRNNYNLMNKTYNGITLLLLHNFRVHVSLIPLFDPWQVTYDRSLVFESIAHASLVY